MTVLLGGDSATPKPTQGRKVWGVYVAGAAFHIWTKAEVAELAHQGVEGVMPIVVPPQGENKWWLENYGYATLEGLVREAIAWGLPKGAPICLDVEEYQSAQMSQPSDVLHAWAVACTTHGMRNWVYGSKSFLLNDRWGLRWLAEWPNVTPTNPVLPAGFQGWQYKGNTNGIDLDIFEAGRDYVSPNLKLINLPVKPPVVSRETPPTNAPPVNNAVAKVEQEVKIAYKAQAPTNTKGNTMSSTTITYPTLATLKSWLRQLASIAGIFVSVSNDLHLPPTLRAVLLGGSVWIQKEQHLIDATNDPTTPTIPVPTTAPPAP
jgi:hypothetical protein